MVTRIRKSTASLGSCFSDLSSFATSDFRSPTSPFFSPMSSCGPSPSLPAQKMARLPPLAPASSLRRRQTVPLIGCESSPDSATLQTAPSRPRIFQPGIPPRRNGSLTPQRNRQFIPSSLPPQHHSPNQPLPPLNNGTTLHP